VSFRVGQGYDVHRLAVGRKLVIAGVEIPHERGLLGHSDADVLIHALCDALLGAAALGDIGTHFPDTDPRYADADSRTLLREVVRMLATRGYRVGNVDCTVVAQRPKLAPYIASMVSNIAAGLGVDSAQVSIKAKTNEGIGHLGRAEGIAAHAVVLIENAGG
jgi:2-C-methyl-D-erythritol 2,4-cyclodiphosphate synthase